MSLVHKSKHMRRRCVLHGICSVWETRGYYKRPAWPL